MVVKGEGRKVSVGLFSSVPPSPEAKVAPLKPYGMEPSKNPQRNAGNEEKCTQRNGRTRESRGDEELRRADGELGEGPCGERGVWKEGKELQRVVMGVDSRDYFGVLRSRWPDFFCGVVNVVLAANLLLAHIRPHRAEGP